MASMGASSSGGASGSGGALGSGEPSRVTAVQLDDRTMATIIQGVTAKVQEALRESGGGGEE